MFIFIEDIGSRRVALFESSEFTQDSCHALAIEELGFSLRTQIKNQLVPLSPT
jgi:hypothetical protein